ncbi:unnamed protein product [Rotaria sp. Silwood1]|nr:unnamed protein product [Rotaria sp. Silwood1]CAF4832323.1 unnamed protein product [Rotaria sp. Silwood1]CAF4907890.1 unnamed protein product [Rotaria sp. Silwood1]CAF4977219.1 unnamed protein product [Rotaria sp. Silwood1]
MLTVDQKNRCIQWAKDHKDDDFIQTIFTDESSFQLFRNTVCRWTKNPNNALKLVPKNRQKVHAWGAISMKGVLSCHTLRCNLSGPYYVHILKNYLLPADNFIEIVVYRTTMTPKHTSNIFQQFNDKDILQLLEWPSNSPDVNPVENLWSIVKCNIEKTKPSNIDELELFLAEKFKNIDIDTVRNCVMSMKKRCLSLIDCKGERIKY